ncbi:hypothetical protein C8Q80DRAFT_128957 [Daedaleopsis nitida]|nr:hypothetical protein C8Q80DRAFT_128957 [Daedaleopsis nitida]
MEPYQKPIKSRQPPLVVTTRCHHCGAEEHSLPEGQKLKRCTGCKTLVFCSKECQKASWSEHKLLCRRPTSSTQPIDGMKAWLDDRHVARPMHLPSRLSEFPNPTALCAELTDFLNHHKWAMATIVRARVYLLLAERGGVEILKDRPCVYRQFLAPVQVPDPNGSNQWLLRNYTFGPAETRPEDDPDLDDAERARRRAVAKSEHASHREKYGDVYVSTVVTRFSIEGTHVHIVRQYPMWTLQDPNAMRDPGNRVLAQQLADLCVEFVNDGISLRTSWERPLAEAGRYIMKNKKWEWTPVVEDNTPTGVARVINRLALHSLHTRFASLHHAGILI